MLSDARADIVSRDGDGQMRFGSVCSGIEAASVAWNPLGWEAAWFSEIEPFPCALLAHHYPNVPNLGDMTTIAPRILSGEVEAPDILCGGTPCPASSTQKTTRSDAFSPDSLSVMFPLKSLTANGAVQAMCSRGSVRSHGERWMLNISECPNDAVGSSLSQVLEMESTPAKYYLSAQACNGILRRSERRGKPLPPLLKEALEHSVLVQQRVPARHQADV